jgi:NAD(P)-dependent dehydrogenase (short-subunit alcohol dehydrogenase family)
MPFGWAISDSSRGLQHSLEKLQLGGQADAMVEIMKRQSIGRLGRADEVTAAVLWLCSPGASFVIGAALPVDGGLTSH